MRAELRRLALAFAITGAIVALIGLAVVLEAHLTPAPPQNGTFVYALAQR